MASSKEDSVEPKSLTLYSEECLQLLEKAVERAEKSSGALTTIGRQQFKSRYADYSSEDEQGTNRQAEDDSASPSSSEDDEESDQSTTDDANAPPTTDASGEDPKRIKKKKKRTKMEMNQRQKELLVQRYFQTLSRVQIPLPASADDDPDTPPRRRPLVLELPAALLSKDQARMMSDNDDGDASLLQARCFRDLAVAVGRGMTNTTTTTRPVVILFLRTGRFAGAVFQGLTCVAHRTLQRYTVRKGQGKAQSAQDSANGKAKSVGAQLRRAGEVALQQDLTETLVEWKDYIKQAAVVLISTPKTMKKNLFVGAAEQVWSRDDDRVRRVPLDLGRPTFENASLIHSVLMTAVVREADDVEETSCAPFEKNLNDVESNGKTTGDSKAVNTKADKKEAEPPARIFPELSEIHIAAMEGDIDKLQSILTKKNEIGAEIDVNQAAGPDWMTALHFAAESTATIKRVEASIAADCITLLLETGHADPGVVDARNRPPYFLASHERVRDAFRMARATLGEEYCLWDESAKVGPPLAAQDIEARKEKEAEKRRKKKTRQKENKAKEKEQAAAAERARKEEEDRRTQEEEAKRIRDGLQPKVATISGGRACDFCQTVCKGRRRNDMFKRLDYCYCSLECVQKHKRELMAAAAIARFGG